MSTLLDELLAAEIDLSDDGWKLDGLCAQTDPEAFFPEKGGSTKGAKRVCTDCPVRAACLQTALRDEERFGIWGGYSERERRRINHGARFDPSSGQGGGQQRGGRRPGPIVHGTPHGYWRGCDCADCRGAVAEYNRDKTAS